MRRRRAALEAVNLLDLRPVRTADWREVAGRVVVERPPSLRRGLGRLIETLSFLTGVRRLRLDELGGATWRLLDGGRTVAELSAELRAAFGAACEPAEERLRLFLTMLRREKLVGYPGWDDPAIARWRERPPGPAG
jgi:hypothetical protein